MTLKKPYTLRQLSQDEVTQLDRNFQSLFENKIESRYTRDGVSASAIVLRPYQSAEHGNANFSANGSAVTIRNFVLAERPGVVIYANAHATNAGFLATVTDITGNSLTIGCGPISVSGSSRNQFSDVTNGQIRVWWTVLSSNP